VAFGGSTLPFVRRVTIRQHSHHTELRWQKKELACIDYANIWL
jgi:hypothetical protein